MPIQRSRGLLLDALHGAVERIGSCLVRAPACHVVTLGHCWVGMAENIGGDAGRQSGVLEDSGDDVAEAVRAELDCFGW
ncbi:hypothetical protein ASD42_27175 [Nocardia sp. Root136]|nr:hypothetical protein ASD42_27175 [Nocardia sp. Root136]